MTIESRMINLLDNNVFLTDKGFAAISKSLGENEREYVMLLSIKVFFI